MGVEEMEDGDGETGEKGVEDGGDQRENPLREWVRGVKVRGRRFFLFMFWNEDFGVGILDWVVWTC